MPMIIDPRLGDVEDDASSTKRRSLLAIAGSLLAEISLPKLADSLGLFLIVLPAVLLGLAPLIARVGWHALQEDRTALHGIWPLLLLVLVAALGWIGGRPLAPGGRAGLLVAQLLGRPTRLCAMPRGPAPSGGALSAAGSSAAEWHARRLRAVTAAGAGLILCARAGPGGARLAGLTLDRRDRGSWPTATAGRAGAGQCGRARLGGYLAAASLVWGIADAAMDQPRDLAAFDGRRGAAGPGASRICRTCTSSASATASASRAGASGPRGNERLAQVLERLDAHPRGATRSTSSSSPAT